MREPPSLLTDGRIPPHTICPFREMCAIAREDKCYHHGVDHNVPFSCGAARAFDICREDPGGGFAVMVFQINEEASKGVKK